MLVTAVPSFMRLVATAQQASTWKGSGVLSWLEPRYTPSKPSCSARTTRSRIRDTSFMPPLGL